MQSTLATAVAPAAVAVAAVSSRRRAAHGHAASTHDEEDDEEADGDDADNEAEEDVDGEEEEEEEDGSEDEEEEEEEEEEAMLSDSDSPEAPIQPAVRNPMAGPVVLSVHELARADEDSLAAYLAQFSSDEEAPSGRNRYTYRDAVRDIARARVVRTTHNNTTGSQV